MKTNTKTYRVTEDGGDCGTIDAKDVREALRIASENVDPDNYAASGRLTETTWITVRVRNEDDPDDCDSDRVAVDPTEPECKGEHEHDWQSPMSVVGGIKENPGVYGHGGGVVCTEVCCHCGRYRISDSWAQDPETGEQGLASVEYRDADGRSLAYVRRTWIRSGKATATVDVRGPDGCWIADIKVTVDSDGECAAGVRYGECDTDMDGDDLGRIWSAIENDVIGSKADGGKGETGGYRWTIEIDDAE